MAPLSVRLRVLPQILPIDGREVELQATATFIQWRYVADHNGEYAWQDLIAIADITGPAGPAIELRTDGSYIQYRTIGATTWIDLILVSDLVGPQGVPGEQGPQGPSVADGDKGDIIVSSSGTAWSVGRRFNTVAILLADTSMAYAAGTQTVSAGQIVEAQGFRYEVAASGASDQHVTTAGGVKLYVLPGIRGLPAPAFGAIGDGTVSQGSMYSACTALWNAALATEQDMYFPAGFYEIGNSSFPWRQQGTPTSLLDCKNISLNTDGPQTVFATNSDDGADVFQLNGIKNFNVRGFPTITATLTGFAGAGSNGCSITNGFDNLHLELTCEDLPRVDKGANVDGGKALTVQPSTTVNECGSLKATVRAIRCAYGFGADLFLDTMKTKKMAVDVDIYAEDCYRAVVVSGVPGTGVDDIDLGLNIAGIAVNCQQDAVLSRANGARCNLNIITNKTAAARRLAPDATPWLSTDSNVRAILSAASRNMRVRTTGNKGECNNKAVIGNSTVASYFDLDIGGTAPTAADNIVLGGGTVNTSVFSISPRTAVLANLPSLMVNPTYGNLFDFAGTLRAVSPLFADAVRFAMSADGVTETGLIDLFGSITGLQGKGVATTGAVIAGLYDQGGTFRLGVRNGNGIVVDALGTAVAIGAYVGKHPVYNASGTLIGYFPIYA